MLFMDDYISEQSLLLALIYTVLKPFCEQFTDAYSKNIAGISFLLFLVVA